MEDAYEIGAKAEAEFDGRPWLSMGRTDRVRYIARFRAAILAYEAAKPKQEAVWRTEVKRGPDGEENYAWLYRNDEMICTAKTHRVQEIVEALNASPPDTASIRPDFDAMFQALEKAISAPQSSPDPLGDMVARTNLLLDTYVTALKRADREGDAG